MHGTPHRFTPDHIKEKIQGVHDVQQVNFGYGNAKYGTGVVIPCI